VQPGKREDVMLLGEWLQHAVHNKKCYDSDGHAADIDVSFHLHSIAFLEIVRQVHVQKKLMYDVLQHNLNILEVFLSIEYSVSFMTSEFDKYWTLLKER